MPGDWHTPKSGFYAVAGAGVPKPGSFGGAGLAGTSGRGGPAGGPGGGAGWGAGGGGVNLPVRTISSTCEPSRVSTSSSDLAINSSLSRFVVMMFLAIL